MVTIRSFEPADATAVWSIFQAVVAGGDTFAFDETYTEEQALTLWTKPPARGYVAVDESGTVLGTCFVRPNQPGRGSHVANAGFMTGEAARGKGVGRAMGKFILAEARRLGFIAMQFNFVVSTNAPAVALWEDLGFRVIGTVPRGFHHKERGVVDVFVMYRDL
jgi:L-amino acid N-acyltransferase YncA